MIVFLYMYRAFITKSKKLNSLYKNKREKRQCLSNKKIKNIITKSVKIR